MMLGRLSNRLIAFLRSIPSAIGRCFINLWNSINPRREAYIGLGLIVLVAIVVVVIFHMGLIGTKIGQIIVWILVVPVIASLVFSVSGFVRELRTLGWRRSLVYILAILLPFSYLYWVGGRTDNILPHAAFLVAAATSIIAAFSAQASRDSATAARESLDLTRATMRPFLNTAPRIEANTTKSPIITLDLGIHNSGNLPAHNIRANVQFLDNDNYQDCLTYFQTRREVSTICFPGESVGPVYESSNPQLWTILIEKPIKLRIEIIYYNTDSEFHTNRSFSLFKSLPIWEFTFSPIPEEDNCN